MEQFGKEFFCVVEKYKNSILKLMSDQIEREKFCVSANQNKICWNAQCSRSEWTEAATPDRFRHWRMQSDQKLIVNVSTFYSCSTQPIWFSLVLKILECSRQNFTSHFQGRISSGSVWSIRPTAWKLERGHQPWHNIGAGHEISEKEEARGKWGERHGLALHCNMKVNRFWLTLGHVRD